MSRVDAVSAVCVVMPLGRAPWCQPPDVEPMAPYPTPSHPTMLSSRPLDRPYGLLFRNVEWGIALLGVTLYESVRRPDRMFASVKLRAEATNPQPHHRPLATSS